MSQQGLGERSARRTRGALWFGLIALLALAWWVTRDDESTPEPELRAGVEPPEAEPSPRSEANRTVGATRGEAAPAAATVHAEDEPTEPHLHEPHPITEEHLRNYRQVDLLYEAWAAIKRGDYKLGRQIVAVHRAEYPDQWEDMNEGLQALADCMQNPGPETVAVARRFYDERTASMMRKRVRRYCLEPYEPEFADTPTQ